MPGQAACHLWGIAAYLQKSIDLAARWRWRGGMVAGRWRKAGVANTRISGFLWLQEDQTEIEGVQHAIQCGC